MAKAGLFFEGLPRSSQAIVPLLQDAPLGGEARDTELRGTLENSYHMYGQVGFHVDQPWHQLAERGYEVLL